MSMNTTSRQVRRAERDTFIRDLDQFQQRIKQHTWSFTGMIRNFRDFIKAVQFEERLIFEAISMKMYGTEAVETYYHEQQRVLNQIVDERVEKRLAESEEGLRQRIEKLEERLEETRQKYMRPIDVFKEKLELHDWFYHYIDNTASYLHWDEREKALLKEVEEGGEEFKQAWQDAVMKYRTKPQQEVNERYRARQAIAEQAKQQFA